MFMVDTGDLVITSVQPSDTGNYTCTASNVYGVVSDIVEVVVRGEDHCSVHAWACCVTSPCCLFDLACFFSLPSFSSH